MNTAKSGHKFLIDICGYLIKSCLLFGIIKLIVPVPRELCLDRDLCCEIVPSLSWLSLRHYLHIISPYQDIVPSGTCTISLYKCHLYYNDKFSNLNILNANTFLIFLNITNQFESRL